MHENHDFNVCLRRKCVCVLHYLANARNEFELTTVSLWWYCVYANLSHKFSAHSFSLHFNNWRLHISQTTWFINWTGHVFFCWFSTSFFPSSFLLFHFLCRILKITPKYICNISNDITSEWLDYQHIMFDSIFFLFVWGFAIYIAEIIHVRKLIMYIYFFLFCFVFDCYDDSHASWI